MADNRGSFAGRLKRLNIAITTSPRTPSTKKACTSPVKPVSVPGSVSTVTPFLLISDDRVQSHDVVALGLSAIIDCRLSAERELRGRLDETTTSATTTTTTQIKRLDLPLRDVGTEDVSKYLLSAVHFIEQERLAGGKVLVHCTRGISRSSAVVCAFLMWSKHVTFRQALAQLRECHPSAEPNPSFAMQLVEFETVGSKSQVAFEVSPDGRSAIGPLSREAAEGVLSKAEGVLLLVSRPDDCQYLFCASGESNSLKRAESFAKMLTSLEMAPTRIETISPRKGPSFAPDDFENNVRFMEALNKV